MASLKSGEIASRSRVSFFNAMSHNLLEEVLIQKYKVFVRVTNITCMKIWH